MEYNFTDEILDIIKQKTINLLNKLKDPDPEPEPETELNPDADADAELNPDSNLKQDLDPDTNLKQDPDTNLKQDPDPDQDSNSKLESNLESQTDTQDITKQNINRDELSQDFLEKFKLFHNDTRVNTTLLKYIIHKKIEKIKESDNLILFKELKEFTNNKEITELIWEYIHSVYLLYEYALLEPNKEILTALIQKINVDNEDENNNSLITIDNNDNYDNNNYKYVDVDVDANEGDIFDKIKEKKEYKIFNDVFNSITKNMDVDPTTANTDFINDIMDDIKTNINNSDGVDDLFNSTKNIGEKYKNMFNDGKINMNDLMSSMMKIMSDPKNISNTIKDINVKKIPDMNSIVNKLVTEVQSSDDIKNMMNSNEVKNMMNSDMLKNMNFDQNNKDFNPMDMLKNMNFDPSKKDFNPMDIISNMMNGSSTSSSNDTPLTNEQISEMENFYSNLNIGNESN